MVEDTGKTLCTGPGKPVNAPEPVTVEEDAYGLPLAIKAKNRQAIRAIEDRWLIEDEWWRRESVARLYYAVRLASGHRLVLYKDLATNCWYQQAY